MREHGNNWQKAFEKKKKRNESKRNGKLIARRKLEK